MRSHLPHVLSALFGAILGGALLVGVQVYANDDNNPATDSVPRAFSYQGHLDWDGLPVNGNTLMTFELYGAPDSTTAKWTETQTVPIFNGRFGAELGANGANPIEAAVYDAGPLFLGITVQRFDEDDNLVGDPVVLGNRQKINPVPYALWATQSSNLNVANDLNVGRDAIVTGSANIGGSANVGGDVVVNRLLRPSAGGTLNNGVFFPTDPGGGSGDAAWMRYYVEGGENTRLQIGINNDAEDDIEFFQAGSPRMRIVDGNVSVLNELYVAGNAYAQGGRKLSSNLRRTGPFALSGRDNITFFDAGAPNDRSICFLTRVHLYDDNDDDDHMVCEVHPAGGNNWHIYSYTTATDHGTQNCRVFCLIWD